MATEQIRQVKEKTDIVNVISERIKLVPSGRNFKAVCPFHQEKSPSFFVSPEMQMYKCFGCGVSGDVISFMQAFDGLTFPESLELLANKVGVVLEKGYKTSEDQIRDKLLEILHLTAELYEYLLHSHKTGTVALAYAKTRGMYKSTLKTYKVGYAPNSWDFLLSYLVKKKKYELEDVESAGLIIKSHKSNKYYDRFRNRLMFPLSSISGQIVGFSGRLLDSEVKEAKYINTPETSLYHKSKHLFGLKEAKKAIHEQRRVIVVEGELDVLSSHQVGVKEIIAVKGSSLTADHLRMLKRLTGTILLAMDSDVAGQDSMLRTIELAEGQELNLRIVPLVGGKDPDDIARDDSMAWKAMLKDSISVFDFYLHTGFSRFGADTGSGRKKLTEFVVPVLSRIQNKVEQAFYINKLAQQLSVDESIIISEINRFSRNQAKYVSREINDSDAVAKPKLTRQQKLEYYVLSALFQLEGSIVDGLNELNPDWFTQVHLQKLVKKMKQVCESAHSVNISSLIHKLPRSTQTLVEDIYTFDTNLLEQNSTSTAKMYSSSSRDLRLAYGKRRLVEIGKMLSDKSVEESDIKRYQTEYHQLSKTLAE